jgi:hypothetical protein
MPIQQFMIFKQHADLSKECFQLIKEFNILFKINKKDHFNVITFSHCKVQNIFEGDLYLKQIVKLKKLITSENKELLQSQMRQIESLNNLKKAQSRMKITLNKKFSKLSAHQTKNNEKVHGWLRHQVADS